MPAYHKYVAQLSGYHKQTGYAKNPMDFKKTVWEDIKDGYTYGYKDWQDFNNRVMVERVME